jgi:hypothetical protein
MDEKHKEEITEIINGLQCPKDFVCYTSGLKRLCRAEDIGLNTYIVCLEKNPQACNFFAVIFGDKHLCQCPLRVYIAKRMSK